MQDMTDRTAPDHAVVDGALLVTGATGGQGRAERLPLRRSGIRLADGGLHPLATSVFRNRIFSPLTDQPLPAAQAWRDGLAIFGGVASGHFGHLVTQALGRLWAGDLAPDAPILFLPETADFQKLPKYFGDLVESLGVKNELRLVSKVTQCERLLIPKDICNLAYRPSASPKFRGWLAAARPKPAAEARELVYVSRTQLGLGTGQFLQEAVLEAALSANDYRVFHPERHSIAEQIDVYQTARRLVFADGSAAHLWSLVARPEQEVAVILRRPRDREFARWFRSLDCPRPVYVDAGIADFSTRGAGPARSITLLDLDAVWAELRTLGFHRDARQIGVRRDALERWVATLVPQFADPGTPPMELDGRSMDLLARCNRAALRPTPGPA